MISLFFIFGCQKPSNEAESYLDVLQTALVIGSDDRVEVNRSSSLTKMVGQITVRQAQTPGALTTCTATLIGKNYLITAAHCVFHPDKGGVPESILFTPDLYRQKEDRQALYFVERIFLPKEHVELRNKDVNFKDYMVASDLAVLKIAEQSVSKSAGEAYGYLEIAPTLQSQNVTIISYPGDKPKGTQWIQEKCGFSPYQRFMSVDCDLIIGASGGAIITEPQTNPRIRGVVSGETTTHNLSAILTDSIVAAIQRILRGENQNLFEEHEIQAQAYHRLMVHNKCDEVLYLGVRWQNLDGEEQVDGFHILQPGQTLMAAEMTSYEYAVYAMNPTRSFEIKGPVGLDIGGMPVGAIEQRVSGEWQDVNLRIDCRSGTSIH